MQKLTNSNYVCLTKFVIAGAKVQADPLNGY